MSTSLKPEATQALLVKVREANRRFAQQHAGDVAARQPVHTVYGGAHLFKADLAGKLGGIAIKFLREYLPDPETLSAALGLHENASRVHERIVEKLMREPVEDLRCDFEDGYGNRPDAEEDAHAREAALEMARGMAEQTLPPFIGIRIKSFSDELLPRAVRTLDLFVTTLLSASGGRLPANFVVTLPKVNLAEQVRTLAALLAMLEEANGLSRGALKLEIMIETPQAVIAPDGSVPLRALVSAADGRCVAAHFGTYDYTASLDITAAVQSMAHPACDFAKSVMQVALAGTGVALSDGATTRLPIAKHKAATGVPLTPVQFAENRAVVHAASRLHFEDVRRSLRDGFYQGWDLHPAQLVTRYAAVASFFLEGQDAASRRLQNFVEKAAQATLSGDAFDDAATGQGLLNFFLRGVNCGALTEADALATGLTLDELRGKSFVKLVAGRRAK